MNTLHFNGSCLRPLVRWMLVFLPFWVTALAASSGAAVAPGCAVLAFEYQAAIPASAIPVRSSATSRFELDCRKLSRWFIDEVSPPLSAIVPYKDMPVWQRRPWLIAGILSASLLQTVLIAWLLYERRARRRAQESLDERLSFETLLADVSAMLSNLPVNEMDAQIQDCLGRVAEFLQADSGSLCQFAAGARNLSATHSWRADGVNPPPLLVFADDSPALQRALNGGPLVLSRIDELPLEATADRNNLDRYGVKSLAVARLEVGGSTIGALTFVASRRPRTWPPGLVQRIQMLAEIFANALDRKESEKALRQSEALHSGVLASLEEYVTVVDRDGIILRTSPTPAVTVSANGEGLLHKPSVGLNFFKLWRRSLGGAVSPPVEAVESVLQGRKAAVVLEYEDPASPENRCFEIRVQKLNRLEGGAVITFLDITSRKKAELKARRNLDEIAHLNRVASMGELTASLAHELNQPLTAILSNAQAGSRFLSSKPPDLAEIRSCLAEIVADDKRAGEVIKRMRALMKKEEFQRSAVNLNEVVDDVIRLVRPDAVLRKASVIFEPYPGLASVLGDRIQLYQVVLNLTMNGLEAVAERPPDDRWVLVRTAESDNGSIELTVEDSGKGITESDLHRIFEPFFTTKPEGLGMGLSISQSIVRAHGGRLWAANSAGGGVIFSCVLPVAQRAAPVFAK